LRSFVSALRSFVSALRSFVSALCSLLTVRRGSVHGGGTLLIGVDGSVRAAPR